MALQQIRQRIRRAVLLRYDPHPIAQLMVAKLNGMTARDLNGSQGTIRWGDPSQLGGIKATGYVAPPQNYAGAGQLRPTDGGTIRAGMRLGGLPGTQAPYSEMSPQLAQIASAQSRGGQSL